jgi:flagellar biosynthetic protein FliQ
MTEQSVINIAVQALIITLKLALPVLGASMVVGLVISLFQSVTSIQEFTLTFVPKLAAIILVFVIAGPWMLHTFVGYTDQLFREIPQLLNQG